MTRKIFFSIFLAVGGMLALCISIMLFVIYNHFAEIRMNELKSQLDFAAAGVETNGMQYFDRLDENAFRLTWIDGDGRVLFDTDEVSSKMENHFNREEIKEAFQSGSGESTRYSSTLLEKTMYYAKRISNDTVLRISASYDTIPTLLIDITQPIIIIFIAALIISVFVAMKLSKSIVEPINRLDLDRPLENDLYDEVSPILRKLENQKIKIGEQKEELGKKKEEFFAITDNMNEGLMLLSKEKHILSINPSAELFFSADSSCIGKSFIEIERRCDINQALDEAEEKGKSEICVEHSGRIYQMNISCIGEKENVSGMVILIFDITDKVNSERHRREFTANVSHELKTPLQSIMGSAELIENGIVKSEDMPKFIGNIRSESARLLTLIEDIIRLSSLDEGTDLPKCKIDLYQIVQEEAERLNENAKNKGVTVCICGESTEIDSVKQLVQEAVYNLIDNAIKYNKENGTVNILVDKNNDKAFVRVSDTGIGIAAEHVSRVFERFYRVDKSRSKKIGGTGLGLSIVKHIAEDIGADIELKSKINEGTQITIKFPIA